MGLFGAGAAIAKLFPSAWTQPIVLLALGAAFLFVSRTSTRTRASSVAKLPARSAKPGAAPSPAPAPATVPVEQSA